MGKEEDREGEEKGEEREEERKVGSEDEGEGGSTPLSDPSVRVTGEEEECRAEGEKQAEKPQRETERRKCCVQVERNEAIRIWDLVLNSGT